MADTQLSAIDKSHYDAWLRYIQTLKDKSTKIWKCKVAGKTGEEKNYL